MQTEVESCGARGRQTEGRFGRMAWLDPWPPISPSSKHTTKAISLLNATGQPGNTRHLRKRVGSGEEGTRNGEN